MDLQDPGDEAARLAALRAYGILDTPAEQDFDDLVQLAASVCEVPIAGVALVDENRVWFKARLGADIVEIPRESSFAAESIRHADIFVVSDASAQEGYAGTPLEELGIRFFAGAPLVDPGGTEARRSLRPRPASPRAVAGTGRGLAGGRTPGDEPAPSPAHLDGGECGASSLPDACRAASRRNVHRRARRRECVVHEPANRDPDWLLA